MDDPELVTLLGEDEPEPPPPPPPSDLGRKLVIQMATVLILKVATGLAIKRLTKTIREFDVLYPEHLGRINWKDFP